MLVALDGSVEARQALEPALKIAQLSRCPLELVTVYDPVHSRWAHDLDNVAEGLGYDQVEVTLVGAGWAGDIIVQMASEQPGTLVCMASHNRDQLDRLFLGSVSTHVIGNNAEPVLLVGPGYQSATAPARYERLVVCLDDSPRAAAALAVAATWARIARLETELVHVASPAKPQIALDVIEADLVRTANALTGGHMPITPTVLIDSSPAESIANFLANRPTAIALTATHGRTGLPRLLLGSVTAELLIRSPTPLLVTHAHGASVGNSA